MRPDFTYLQVPLALYSIEPKKNDALEEKNGKLKRRFFHNVPYTSSEMKQIEEFREYAAKNHKNIECSLQDTLRYLYSSEFNHKECCERIGVFLEWTHNPYIQSISEKAEKILKNGVVSTFGRDREDRPIIFMKIGEIDLKQNCLQDYYSAINAVLSVVIKYLFVKGVIQSYCFVVDMGSKNFTSLPFDTIITIIKKLSVVYSMLLGRMLIINTNSLIRLSYCAISKLLHEETVKKIKVLGSQELQQMTEFISESQLECKNGGLHPNIHSCWPPKVPNFTHNFDDESIYYSVTEDNPMFAEEAIFANMNGTCCENTQCTIF